MSDQPSGKVSDQKTASAHLKTVLINTVVGGIAGVKFHAITLAPKKLIRTRRASEGSASEPSRARRVSMCKDAKLSCRGNISSSERLRLPR